MLLGIAVIPKLSLQLMPSSRSNELSVSFSWANANPEMLEMEVTSKLEGVFSRIKGLNNIYSQTKQGYGIITLAIDKNEDIDATKLYVSSLIRSLAKSLPEGVRVSAVQGGEIQQEGLQDEEERQLLQSYTITGPGSSQDVALFAEDHIVPEISQIADIENAQLTQEVKEEKITAIENLMTIDHQENSYIGRIGKAISPIMEPLGFNWKISVSLLSGMAAKEIVVSTLGVLYTGSGDEEQALADRLMQETKPDGTAVFTPLVGLSLMFFVLLYFPCIATIVAIKNESNSWKWGIFTVAYTCVLAWIVSFLIYQIGSLIV